MRKRGYVGDDAGELAGMWEGVGILFYLQWECIGELQAEVPYYLMDF